MDHIGIDVHKKVRQICILAEGGELLERRVPTQGRRFAEELGARPHARILLESATERDWVARCLEGLGHEVVVADPNFAPMYATRTRKVQTDRRDARALAEACLRGASRPAHRLSDAQRQVRARLTVRDPLVRTRTRYISLVRALLRQHGCPVLDVEATRWVSARRDFFLPVRVLAQVFRGKLLDLFAQALDHGKCRGGRDEAPRQQLTQAARKQWVVYSKPPFAGAEQVLAYLGRYAYRIALSNDRLVDVHDGQVTFRWKDRAHGNAPGSPRSTPGPSCAAFSFMFCPAALSGSAITASSPTRCACRHCPGCASGSPRRSSPGHRRPPGSRNGGTRCCSA